MGNPNHIDEATIGEIRIPDINIFDRVHKSFLCIKITNLNDE